jgi:Uma2 family endonuclease
VSTITTKPSTFASPPRGMTVDEFEQLEQSLGDARIELIEGRVFTRDDMNPPHVLATGRAKRAIESVLPSDRFIREEKPVRILDFNEPFPDLAVVRGDLETYADHYPGPEEVSLVIEISDTTLAKDRGVKQENYARAGIPFYWVVNLGDRQVEVYSDPRPGGYVTRDDYRSGQSVPVVMDGTAVGDVAVDDMLPRVPGQVQDHWWTGTVVNEDEKGTSRGTANIRYFPWYVALLKENLLFPFFRAFLKYRRIGGARRFPLPDFTIGAHAEVDGLILATREAARYRTYFPSVSLITP